ncbi:MAG: hypothetical protein Q4E75_04675, partial [bacterium]|nr:hypothetical protein [bacterium]
ITADNEINVKEITRLREWMEKNTHLLGTFFYDRLHIVVNDVLKDGVLDDTEKQQLFILLTFLLKDNSLNQKIDVLKESVKEKEVIGNKLIELIDDNTIIKKIHKEAMAQMRILVNRNCSVYAIDSEIVFLSLTLIGLLKYDSNFWDHVREEYEELYSKFNDQKIEGQIRNVINKYKTDNDPRIISYVLKNAIVPKPFLPSFFDFIFDIYRLNFDYSIDPNSDLYDEFSFVYDGIKKGMNYDDDSLVVNVTHKTYQLIKTTKELILDENKVNSLIELSVAVLKIIDAYYWSNNTTEFENEYYKFGFETWRERSEKTIQESKTGESKLRSRWEPEFKLNGNQIYISIPNHKIKSYYDYEQLRIKIYNDEELVYENDRPDVYDIIGGYRIEQKDDVKIERPIEKVRYVLSCGDDIIYDSKDKLYRDYIFFNESGNEIKNNRDYKGLALLCSKTEIEGMQKLYSGDNYVISYKSVNPGDYIKVENELFNFSTILTPGIIGQEKDGKVIINNTEQIIYSEVEGIVYESEKSINNIALIINEERHRLSDYEVEEKRRGLYYNYFIKLPLVSNKYEVNIEELENGYYSNKRKFAFVVDNNFEFKVETSNIEEYLVTIKFLNENYTKAISLNDDDINKLVFDDDNLEFIIPNGLRIFKLDDDKWYRLDDLNNYIWINDISVYSNLRISGINFTSVQVKDEQSNLLTTLFPSIEKFYYDLSVGTLRSYDSHNYIYLDFFNEDKKIGFLKIYCKCFINENMTTVYFDKDDNKYHGTISYYGKGNVVVRVTDQNGNITFEKQITSNDSFEIDSIRSFENYKLEVVEKKLGFTLQSNNVLYSKDIKYYSFDDFEGRYFQIYSVDYDQMIMKKYINKTRLLYNTYVEITERVDTTSFIGNVYVHKGEKKYIDRINPVEIEFASDPDSNGQILTYITNEGEMLFNDFTNHTILNNLDSYDAIPIYSYVINMERKK